MIAVNILRVGETHRTPTMWALAASLLLGLIVSCAHEPAEPHEEAPSIMILPPQMSWLPPPKQAPVTEGYVDVGGARIWYWDSGGDGDPVVFVHPFSGSALTWEYQQPVLAKLGYRVIAYSRRGHYRSDVGDLENPGTGVDDLYQLVEHLGLDKVHLVGIAAGADVVPDFAVSFPERLLTLTIGSTIGKPGDPGYRASDETLLPPEFRALPTYLKELSPAYRAGNPEGVARWRELESMSKSQRVRIPPKNSISPELIAGIDIPTLLFTGDSDLYMPPSRLRAYARYWRDPEVVIFREAGHAPYWEQPDAFNRMLLDFFEKHSRSGADQLSLADAALNTAMPDASVFGQRDVDITVLPAQSEWQPVPKQAPVTEGYIDVDGVKLWYWDTGGEGVPVVLLHPYTGSALIWGYQQPELVKAGYRVIAYSRRGHYGSDIGPTNDLVASADDLHALINHLQLEQVHLVGSAAGGFIVPDYAVSYPDNIRSITIATSTGGARAPQYRYVFSNYLRTQEVVELPHWVKELGPAYRDANPEGTKAWIEMEQRSVQAVLRPPAKNSLQWNDYEALDLPVLLIGADSDMYMPPAMLRELAARIKDVEVVMLTESGHSGYWEQPQAFNRALLEFLKRKDGLE